jgi:hypothetical protein
MMFESALATAMALIGLPSSGLIPDQVGVLSLAFLLRQRLDPPASIEFGSLGSRMNGAIQFALP